jgi:hypothetical protein
MKIERVVPRSEKTNRIAGFDHQLFSEDVRRHVALHFLNFSIYLVFHERQHEGRAAAKSGPRNGKMNAKVKEILAS